MTGADAEQCPKRAEVFAPEAPFDLFQQDDHQEYQQGEQGQVEDRLVKGHQIIAPERVEVIDCCGDERNPVLVGEIEDAVHQQIVDRVERQRQGAQEDGQGIEQSEQLDAENGGDGHADQQQVLDPSPVAVDGAPAAADQFAAAVEGGTERADPAAEKPPERNCQGDQEQGRPEFAPVERSRCQGVGQGSQRINAKQQADRVGELVEAVIFRLHEQPEKTEQAEELDEASQVDFYRRPVHSSCIRLRSITPSPRRAAVATVGICSGR